MLSKYQPAVSIVGAVILPNIGGWAGGLITRQHLKPWYESLKKPEWRPPNWAFGPVWTALYCSIGYASYLVYRDGGGFAGNARLPLILYGTNLLMNWAWTPIFFGLHNIKLGLAEIAAMIPHSALCGYLFYKVNPTAGLLFVPYLMWLGLATSLNYVIYRDNELTDGKDDKEE